MKIRTCDKCGQEIKPKQDFIKCSKHHYKDNYHIEFNSIGDLCIKCWRK